MIYALINDAVEPIGNTMSENPSWWPAEHGNVTWLGEVEANHAGFYVDSFLLLMFGGIPWQVRTI